MQGLAAVHHRLFSLTDYPGTCSIMFLLYNAAIATGGPGRPQGVPEAAWTGNGSAKASPE